MVTRRQLKDHKNAAIVKGPAHSIFPDQVGKDLPVAEVFSRVKAIPSVSLNPNEIRIIQRVVGNKTFQKRVLENDAEPSTVKIAAESIQQNTLSLEMIPGFFDRYYVGTKALSGTPDIQRDKIDYRQLTWEDFQGTAPKKGAYEAMTYSELHDPEIDAQVGAPKSLAAEDTGEECKIGKKTTTKYKVNIKIDPEKIEIKPYMWQEKSWRKAWTTENKEQEEKCKRELVKKCETWFQREYAKIDKAKKKEIKVCRKAYDKSLSRAQVEFRKEEKKCKKAFQDGDTEYEILLNDEPVIATNRDECSNQFKDEFLKIMMDDWQYGKTFETGEAVATNKDECETEFAQNYEKLRKETLEWKGIMAGEEAAADSKEACGKELFKECLTRLIPAASSALLQHEQTHFDITAARAMEAQEALRTLIESFDAEVTACGEKKALQKGKLLLQKNINKLKKAYSKQKQSLRKEQKTYDKKTKHGVKAEEQAGWTQQVEERLEKLREKNEASAEEAESPEAE